jgi:hypothetical protein
VGRQESAWADPRTATVIEEPVNSDVTSDPPGRILSRSKFCMIGGKICILAAGIDESSPPEPVLHESKIGHRIANVGQGSYKTLRVTRSEHDELRISEYSSSGRLEEGADRCATHCGSSPDSVFSVIGDRTRRI